MSITASSDQGTGHLRLSGDRIDVARLRRGLSKAETARQLGITARTWSRYVSDGAPVHVAEDLETVLHMPATFFADVPLPSLSVDEVNFRAGRRAAAVHRHAAVAAGVFGVMIDRWIDEHFNRPSWSVSDAAAIDELERTDPVLAAQTLRLMWGLGEGPLPNIVQLCESKGIRVYGLPSVAEVVDAFSGWSDGAPYIFLSRSKTPERSRFDIAHELGHLILHSSSVDSGSEAHHRQEEDADRFAAEFLAPASSVAEHLPRHPSVDQVMTFRSTFKVSAMMTAKALLRSGRTDDAGYRRLCSALARRGFRTGEPDGMTHHERSRIFTHIFGSTAGDKRTTADRIAGDLSLPVADVHALTFSTQVHAVDTRATETSSSAMPTSAQSPKKAQLRLVKG